jgi:colicin import membrane protein
MLESDGEATTVENPAEATKPPPKSGHRDMAGKGKVPKAEQPKILKVGKIAQGAKDKGPKAEKGKIPKAAQKKSSQAAQRRKAEKDKDPKAAKDTRSKAGKDKGSKAEKDKGPEAEKGDGQSRPSRSPKACRAAAALPASQVDARNTARRRGWRAQVQHFPADVRPLQH